MTMFERILQTWVLRRADTALALLFPFAFTRQGSSTARSYFAVTQDASR